MKHRSLVMTNKMWAEGRGYEVGLLAMTQARDAVQLSGPLFCLSHSIAQAGLKLSQYFWFNLTTAVRHEPPHSM